MATPASAFQVLGADQVGAGIGYHDGNYFANYGDELDRNDHSGSVSFSSSFRSGSRSLGADGFERRDAFGNSYGAGRGFGDLGRDSNYQSCSSDSHSEKMAMMSGRIHAYPCQRFR
ncbi:MAG: hypothetical protein R3360_04345 [Alphaproteobacteria bacterium]|nr:hypothetical protein [Alphaproteobacteria bacterium]